MLRWFFAVLAGASVSVAVSAQVPDEFLAMRMRDYAQALHNVIEGNWSRPDGVDVGAACYVLIRQLPGGDVTDVRVLPECSYDDEGRKSVVQAVTRASPLPYQGFEDVFRREIRLAFRGGDNHDRLLRRERRLEQIGRDIQMTERSRHKVLNAMNSKRWNGYVDKCIRHIERAELGRDIPRPHESQRVATLTIDARGNIQDVKILSARNKQTL